MRQRFKHLVTRRQAVKSLITAALLAVIAVGARIRIFQVALFYLSSALGRLGTQPSRARPGPVNAEWASIAAPATNSPLRASRGVITYHPWYQGFRPHMAVACLAVAAELSPGYVRGDVRWSDVLPDGVNPDERAIAWYRSYLTAHCWFGMRPMIVLTSPPSAVLKLNQQSEALMERWKAYITLVAERFGDLCDAYQVMNEPNNPVYSFFPANQQAAAIQAAAAILRAHVANAHIIVNFLMDLDNWRDSISQLLNSAKGAIDVVGIDHYPGTWTFSDITDWDGFVALAQEAAHATQESPWANVRLALIETGFATNVATLRTDDNQSAYFEEVKRIVGQVDSLGSGELLSHIGVYELVDMDTDAFLDPEAHFGLLTSQLKRKSAFTVVASLFASTHSPLGAERPMAPSD